MDLSAAAAAAMPASVAKMQAKAAQLAAELAREAAGQQIDKPGTDGPLSPTTTARLAGSLGAPRRLSQANLTGAKPAAVDVGQSTILQCQRLEAQVQEWKAKHMEAERELQRHQQSYMRREEQLAARLQELEQRLQQAGGQGRGAGSTAPADAYAVADVNSSSNECSSPSSRHNVAAKGRAQPLTLEVVQQQMERGVEELLQHQRLHLRADEAQQLRQFRSRLAEVEAQLQADKRAAAADQDSWMSKTLAVREELARTQEIAVKLDAIYRLTEDEAGQLRVQFKAQEDDRQHLIRQVLGLRRHNHQLQQQVTALQEELEAIMAVDLDDSSTPLQHQQRWQQPGGETAGYRPQSAAPDCHRVRPMTAGPQVQQQHQGGGRWRPLSGAANRHGAGGAGAGAGCSLQCGLEDSHHQQQQQQQYQRVIGQLQKALQCERGQLRQLRAAYTLELGRRNELQTLLLDSIHLAKQQYQQAQAAQVQDPAAWLWWQQEQPGGGSPSSSRPCSKLQARLQQRPSSAVPKGGTQPHPQRLQQLCPGMHSLFGAAAAVGQACVPAAATAATAGAAGGGPIDESALHAAAWAKLLDELLSRQQLLELLLERACPDFVAAAQQLHQGQQQQQLRQQLTEQHRADQAPQVTVDREQQGCGSLGSQGRQQLEAGSAGECQDVDKFMIGEDDGSSGVGVDEDDDPRGASACGGTEQNCEQHDPAEHAVQEQQQHHTAAGEGTGQEQQPAGMAHHHHHQQQQQQHVWQQGLPAAVQERVEPQQSQTRWAHPQQQRLQAHNSADLGSQQWAADMPAQLQQAATAPASTSTTTQHGSNPAATAAAPAAGAHHTSTGSMTLACMSTPLMGAFPVRKLLHSSHQQQRCNSLAGTTQLHKVAERKRPGSAAVNDRVLLGQGGSLSLRPLSAAVTRSCCTAGGGKGSTGSALHQLVATGPQEQQCGAVIRNSSSRSSSSGNRELHAPAGKPQQLSHPGGASSTAASSRSGCAASGAAVSSRGGGGGGGCGWSGADGQAAQQLIRSFLSAPEGLEHEQC